VNESQAGPRTSWTGTRLSYEDELIAAPTGPMPDRRIPAAQILITVQDVEVLSLAKEKATTAKACDEQRRDGRGQGAEAVVIVVDTNVWARALLHDHPEQSSRARRALAAARSKEGVFVPIVVLAELSWVLRAVRWERERILGALESLLRTRGVTTEAPHVVEEAIGATRKGGRGGFADHLIAQIGFANGCRAAFTFDKLFGRSEKVRRLP
jgi:predicted nucleic-acid-binding protein